MYAPFSLFEKKNVKKGPLFPILKQSTSIHNNNPASVVSVVLQKHYFHSICAFSKKKKPVDWLRSCAFALIAYNFTRYKCYKNKISHISKLPSWQHFC